MLLQQKTLIASVAAAAGLVFAAAGYAQTATQAPPQAAPAAGARAPRQPGAGAAARLNLTQAQRDQIRALREAQRNDTRALGEKMRAARQQLREVMRTDPPDEAAVRAAAEAVAAIEVDHAALRARSRAQFMKVLTPEQQAQMKEARARAERQMMARRDRMMRQQGYRWWRGWI
jgi:Spy/CpxP family protein refolding chaperone